MRKSLKNNSPKNRILVSVIITSYNNRPYIRQAIESALLQASGSIQVECIVVDDCSTDDSREYLKELRNNLDFKLFPLQKNGEVAAARNFGFLKSHGDYINYLDGDDYLLPGKIAAQLACLQGQNRVCVTDCLNEIEGEINDIPLSATWGKLGDDPLADLIDHNRIALHAALISRDVARKFSFDDGPEQLAEDYDFWLRIASAGVKFCYLDSPLVVYRRRGQASKSTESLQGCIDLLHVYKNLEKELLKKRTDLIPALNAAKYRAQSRYAYFLALQMPKDYQNISILKQIPREFRGKKAILVSVVADLSPRMASWIQRTIGT